MFPKVFHVKNVPRDDPNFVYCGRPTKWGNPFREGIDGTRYEVIELYKQYIESNIELQEQAKQELRGKHLVCWCSPKPCHCDILIKIANGEYYE